MPEELEGTISPSQPPRVDGKEVAPNSTEYHAWELNCKRLTELYGFDNWYEWKLANWGTKWNTYDGDCDDIGNGTAVLNFQTAWSLPEPIFNEMAFMYRDLEFAIECVEEGGFFSGTINIANGIFEDNLSADDAQWKRLAEEMMGCDFSEDEDEK